MSIACESCVLLGRGHCIGLVTTLDDSYRVSVVCLKVIATPSTMRPWPSSCSCAVRRQFIKHKTAYR